MARLDDLENDLKAVKDKVSALEKAFEEAKGHRETMAADIAKILVWVEGTDKVWGFCRKHWRTALVFGCGVMTSLGIGNPELLSFLKTFFGAI